jgi:molecular chaperone GrpE (heat shock protein)
MKEKQMQNPNDLGHIHRDIKEVVDVSRYYVVVRLSCGHTKEMSRQAYKKYGEDATLCVECTHDQKKAAHRRTNKDLANHILNEIEDDLREFLEIVDHEVYTRCTKTALARLKVTRRRLRQAITAFGVDWRDWTE